MMYIKWGHLVATLPRDQGDYTSLSQNDVISANQNAAGNALAVVGFWLLCKRFSCATYHASTAVWISATRCISLLRTCLTEAITNSKKKSYSRGVRGSVLRRHPVRVRSCRLVVEN
eukprot:6196213-Pleurochrysis_carterae.AAC.1